jgi:hypothetical protein
LILHKNYTMLAHIFKSPTTNNVMYCTNNPRSRKLSTIPPKICQPLRNLFYSYIGTVQDQKISTW